ncbi:aldo/keto reductase [Chryseomicrobium sp. FSL W7-1435]|uniref:aldo/keto reductase n=1 Tax=Chryseomicrobium sp. FSL W7-1435 TaxID=2921704 RepID=UPI00315B0324
MQEKQKNPFVMGCMRINELTDQEVTEWVHHALELGIHTFDHADIYAKGECETRFGEVLKNQPSLREDLVIQTKASIRSGYYDSSKEHLLTSVDESLARLQTDYVDVFMLHRPDALMELDEIADTFDVLAGSGKVKTFGVSNFNRYQLEWLQAATHQPIQINQLQFSPVHSSLLNTGIQANTDFAGAIDRDGGVLTYCQQQSITIQAWSPFQFGFFEGVYLDHPRFPELNTVLQGLADQYSVSKSAIVAAWILRHPAGMQVVAGSTKISRISEIAAASEIELSRKEWYAIYQAAGNRLP